MIKKLFWRIVAGTISIFLATKFVSGVSLEIISGETTLLGTTLNEQWQILFLIGGILGFINYFIKPIIDKITFPLKILTLGLFSLVLNMTIVWFLDILFIELQISGITPLFLTTMIVWITNFFLGLK